MSILKGTIYITDKEEIVYNAPLMSGTKIINLDEDGVLMEHESIIGGTCLLPPIEAKIAEADGNEQMYDLIYANHLLEPFQQQFISALLSYLYKGGNLILFLPELGYTNTMQKLIFHIWDKYGVHIGIIGDMNPQVANCYYDDKCIPIWLNMIYSARVISYKEYLYMYPLDAVIQNHQVIEELINEISPLGESINDKLVYIDRLRKLIHQKPETRPALFQIRRNYRC